MARPYINREEHNDSQTFIIKIIWKLDTEDNELKEQQKILTLFDVNH